MAQSPGNEVRHIFQAVSAARTGLDHLTAVATNASDFSRQLVAGLTPVVQAAQKLSEQLGEMLRASLLLNGGMSPTELYEVLASRTAELITEANDTADAWSQPKANADEIKRALKALAGMVAVAEKLVDESIPRIRREALINGACAEFYGPAIKEPPTPQQALVYRDIVEACRVLSGAFELGEGSRNAREEDTQRKVKDPYLTLEEGLDPATFLHQLDHVDLTAFNASLRAGTEQIAHAHAQTLAKHARESEEAIKSPPIVAALIYLVLESRFPVAALNNLATVQHPQVLDFAERVICYPRHFGTESSQPTRIFGLDKALREAALPILVRDEERLFEVEKRLREEQASSRHHSHAHSSFRALFSEAAVGIRLPMFIPARRLTALTAIFPDQRPDYLRRMYERLGTNSRPSESEGRSFMCDLARHSLRLIGDPVEVTGPGGRSGIAQWLKGPVLEFSLSDERLLRIALRCLMTHGFRDDAALVDSVIKGKKLKSCRSHQEAVREDFLKEDSLLNLANSTNERLLSREAQPTSEDRR